MADKNISKTLTKNWNNTSHEYGYEYSKVNLHFNLDNEDKKIALEVLEGMKKKKVQFITDLILDYMNTHGLTSPDQVILSYQIAKKLGGSLQNIPIVAARESIREVRSEETSNNTSSVNVTDENPSNNQGQQTVNTPNLKSSVTNENDDYEYDDSDFELLEGLKDLF